MSIIYKILYYVIYFYKKQNQHAHPHQIAIWNSINRRKNFRINYSHRGPVAGLPRVFVCNEELNVKNISTGGLLVLDDTALFGDQVGNNYNIRIEWPDYTTEIASQVVGAQMLRRHIQFLVFDPILHKRIQLMIPQAFMGSKFRKTDMIFESDVEELWVGQADSSLHFVRNKEYNCQLLLEGKSYNFSNEGQWLDYNGQVTGEEDLDRILICLANINLPSQNVKKLIDASLDTRVFNLQATGSDNDY